MVFEYVHYNTSDACVVSAFFVFLCLSLSFFLFFLFFLLSPLFFFLLSHRDELYQALLATTW